MTYGNLAEKLLAVSVALSAIELLQLRKFWDDNGTWKWETLKKDFAPLPLPLRAFFGATLNARAFTAIQTLRILGAFWILLYRETAPYNAAILGIFFFSQWLTSIRFRGTFNGGSDSMSAIVSGGLFLAALFPEFILIEKFSYAVIAAQLVASYFMAGVVKLKNPAWRNGTALPQFLNIPGYDRPPQWVRSLLENRRISTFLSLSVITFECVFPLAFTGPSAALTLLTIAFVFHLGNFIAFGLNRFVFAWISAYPILYFWVS